MYGAAIMGVIVALGTTVKINIALMLLAVGTAFLIAGVLLAALL
jgi:hypothetical protein